MRLCHRIAKKRLCSSFAELCSSPQTASSHNYSHDLSRLLTGRSIFTVSQCFFRPRVLTRVRARVFVSLKMARGLRRPGSRARSKVTILWRSPGRQSETQGRLRGPKTTSSDRSPGLEASPGQDQTEETHLVGSRGFYEYEGRQWHHPVSAQGLPAPDTQTQTWRSLRV